MATYVPDRGDVVWLNFEPQIGKEHNKRRPALVLSPRSYNRKTSWFIVCPVTSKKKGYPFEVGIRGKKKLDGVVLADQVRSLDWRARNAVFIEKTTQSVIDEVLAKALTLLTP